MPSHRQDLQLFQPKLGKHLFLCWRNQHFLDCLEFRLGVWHHGLHSNNAIRIWSQRKKIYIKTGSTVREYKNTSIWITIYYNKKSWTSILQILTKFLTLKGLLRCVTICRISALGLPCSLWSSMKAKFGIFKSLKVAYTHLVEVLKCFWN